MSRLSIDSKRTKRQETNGFTILRSKPQRLGEACLYKNLMHEESIRGCIARLCNSQGYKASIVAKFSAYARHETLPARTILTSMKTEAETQGYQ